MHIAIPREIIPGEQRVALTPHLIPELKQAGATILLESGAGAAANYPDKDYSGVEICHDYTSLYQNADIILKVQPPTVTEIANYKKGSIVISFLFPARHPEVVAALCEQHITSFAIELIPRISRAQAMDALSSQATVAGYKAALLAANMTSRFFPMLTTAAGTIRPASVLVVGAGVAGLQAIATARRLGAIVKAYDIRSATKEQVESLGAKMITIDVKAEAAGGYARELASDEKLKQQTALTDAISKTEVIIATAAIPGKPAPKIITREMVEAMHTGGVIIDAAAESGGNCELTQPDTTVNHQGITIYGPTNLASSLPHDASSMYAKNLTNFLKLVLKNGQIAIDWEDVIISESLVTRDGMVKLAE